MKARRGPGSDAGPMRPIPPAVPELWGLHEIAVLVKATNKHRLRRLLPPPDVVLEMGPIWLGTTVREWLRTWDQ